VTFSTTVETLVVAALSPVCTTLCPLYDDTGRVDLETIHLLDSDLGLVPVLELGVRVPEG
jgi:hypothetical protein